MALLCTYNAVEMIRMCLPWSLPLNIAPCSLGGMPEEHIFIHMAKLCIFNSLNRGVFWGESGRLELCLEASLGNSVDTGHASFMREKNYKKVSKCHSILFMEPGLHLLKNKSRYYSKIKP